MLKFETIHPTSLHLAPGQLLSFLRDDYISIPLERLLPNLHGFAHWHKLDATNSHYKIKRFTYPSLRPY